MLATAPAFAHDGGDARVTVKFTSTQCDAFGERCAQVVCNENSGTCKPTGVKYYSPSYDGYYSSRRVCDQQGQACHYLPAGDR
jgi:hypothetical protein